LRQDGSWEAHDGVRLEGTFEVPGRPDEVYGFLTDWSRVAPILPEVTSYEVLDPDSIRFQARVGVSALRGEMRTRLTIVERAPGRQAHYRGRASGLGSSVDLELGFQLAGTPGGTEVRWSGTATIAGRLAALTAGLLERIARRYLTVFVDAVHRALAREPAPPEPA
jgi:carbon monoxide dehydrogenase subunit G